MTIDDFYSILMRHSRVFVEQYKKLHERHPERYPFELPAYDDWFEQFDMYQTTVEE
jgi:hypothetical protein